MDNATVEKTSTGWRSSPIGRIRNISLAPSAKNSLFPLFEAIMNSIHAIEERFGRDNLGSGHIRVEVLRNDQQDCNGFVIVDNGIGFTQKNLDSFVCLDSQTKADIGGKGVGRLLWLKVAQEVQIISTHSEAGTRWNTQFTFCAENPTRDYIRKESPDTDVGTEIRILPYRSEYSSVTPRKLDTICNRILAHFISYFVNISHPNIVVFDDDKSVDLLDQFTEAIERDEDYKFSLHIGSEEKPLVMHCFLLPKTISDDEKSTNALYLGANGRAVKRFEMDSVIGMKAIAGKLAFLGYVESEALDASANETRTDFSLSDDEIGAIVDAAKSYVKQFLQKEITEIREQQKVKISALRNEHPRFLSVTRKLDDFVEKLHLSTQSDEELFVELSRHSLRNYKRRRNAYKKSAKKKLPDIEKNAREFVQGLQSESISSLAEYVVKRKLILEVFEDSLKYTDIDSEKSEYESIVHDIVCPLRSTSEDLNYEDHNLWILDDRLAFYSYFNSDIPLNRQTKSEHNDTDRPDVSIFDMGLGFDIDDKAQPVTIIEFKRPKRDDYTLTDNPITQVRQYVDKIRNSGEVTKYDGSFLRSVDKETPFVCHVIADIKPSLQKCMKDLGIFHQKAGSRSYYAWDSTYRIFFEVTAFGDVLQSAKSRNRAFFEKLGITA